MTSTTGTVTDKATANPIQKLAQEETGPESLIDKHSSLNGHYRSTHNLRIEGTVDGEIECQSTLTIAEEAKVRAQVVAQNVIVGGSLEGEVTCPGRFQILPNGRVVGKVAAGTLEILAGAFYQGELSMHAEGDKVLAVDGKSDGHPGSTITYGLPDPDKRPISIIAHPSGVKAHDDGRVG